MKDYSMTLEERKDFILGFDFDKKGNIIVKYADGIEDWPLPYNGSNMNILLTKMREQVIEADAFKEKKVKEKEKIIPVIILSFGMAVGASVLGLTMFSIPIIDIVCYIMSAALASVGTYYSFQICKISSVLKDLERNRRFLEIEQKLNDSVRNNQNELVNVSKKTKSIILGFPENMPVFDINSFNYVPFSDLEQIMENIERNERFGFDYTEEHLEDRPKIRKRKM